jgi:penicillin amidase
MPRRRSKPLASAVVSLGLSACALLRPLPAPTTVEDRLAMLPARDLPLDRPVRVHWNDHQVPWIEADTDADLAFTLGLVHAHLRLGQMELLRRIGHGRLAEVAGPIAVDLDHSLRILDFGRSVPGTVRMLPSDTRRWLDRFVAGINHQLGAADRLPHEFGVLGVGRQPWTIEDVLTVGRLAGTDINWLLFFSFLNQRDRADWPELWARLVEAGSASIPSFELAADPELAALGELLAGTSKAGSNSVAVAPGKAAGGTALIANDPHLGIFLPNLWLLAGIKSPSYHAVGLMIPGLPFVALGRNPSIAWGGTNMRAASSDLIDLASVPASEFRERREVIRTRWWPDREVVLRDSPYGPVISDAPLLHADGGPLALTWVGHRPSDEISAMLAVNRAQTFEEFRRALAGFAVSGQNMLYADRDGHIGQVMAVHLPRRPNVPPADVVRPPERAADWAELATAVDLPHVLDPSAGFLASANNKAAQTSIPTGYFFSADDRIRRLTGLLAADREISLADLAALQQDVFVPSSLELRDTILAQLREISPPPASTELVRQLEGFDGHYQPESTGAVALELTVYHLAQAFLDDRTRSAYATSGRFSTLLAEDLRAADAATLRPALEQALTAAAEDLGHHPTWGDLHRLAISHVFGRLPLIGGRYRFDDLPVGGSSTSLMKTAHGLTNTRHQTRFGSQARHRSDLGDLDANWFVLLGGQDGWLNSSTFKDQVPLWRDGRSIRMPLRPETVRQAFPHVVELIPRPGS